MVAAYISGRTTTASGPTLVMASTSRWVVKGLMVMAPHTSECLTITPLIQAVEFISPSTPLTMWGLHQKRTELLIMKILI